MPTILLTIFTALSATMTIAAHYLRPPRRGLIYLFKPLTTLLILVVALLPGTFFTDISAGAIALGLIFSLAGDIFLMFPTRFLQGLVSFLIGHLCYWVAFFPAQPGMNIFWSFLPLLVIGGLILHFLWTGLSQALRIPVGAYILVIIGMATLAISRALQMPSKGTLTASVGALLFLTSDSLLAINRFRKPFHLAEAAVLAPYFAGQYLIALSVGLT